MPPLEQITVGDVMHSGIVSCGTGASVKAIAQAMAAEQVHSVVVMTDSQERDEERVWGIVSDLDLMDAGFSKDPESTAATLARQPVVSVKPSMGIRDAAQLMHKYKVAHVVVIDPQTLQPVGILSTMDVAEVLAQQEI
jgi:CBS domain-containing protein